MSDPTAAERQRRYRAHRRGDHSLCPPGREDCVTGAVTPAVTRDAVTAGSPELGTRGRRLWADLTKDGDLRPAERVLVEEACRLADRLDRLDAILRGDVSVWAQLLPANEDGSIVRVIVTGPLSEARQQQVALKQLLSELRQSGTAGTPRTPRQPTGTVTTGGAGAAGVADLTRRIKARQRSTG